MRRSGSLPIGIDLAPAQADPTTEMVVSNGIPGIRGDKMAKHSQFSYPFLKTTLYAISMMIFDVNLWGVPCLKQRHWNHRLPRCSPLWIRQICAASTSSTILRMERSPGPWSPLESFGALYLLFLFEFCSLKATFRAVQGMWTKELVRHLFPGTQQKHSLTAQLVLKQQTETFKALAPRLHSGTTFPEKLSGTTSTDNRLGCQHSWQVLNPVQRIHTLNWLPIPQGHPTSSRASSSPLCRCGHRP